MEALASTSSSRSSDRVSRCRFGFIALVTGLISLAGASAGTAASSSQEDDNLRAATFEPHAHSGLRAGVRVKLTRGFSIAIELIRQQPACRQLFEQLDSDGLEALSMSFYAPVGRGVETEICERGATAYTKVGSSVTRLCPGFARLGERRAAIALIHEALHYAGMREKPLHPEALTADQITRLVTRECT